MSDCQNLTPLRPGDDDHLGIQDGRARKTVKGPVACLQAVLLELGFLPVRRSSRGVYDFYTETAVREFQIFVSMRHVAKVKASETTLPDPEAGGYYTHLERTPNEVPSQDVSITGVFDDRTMQCIKEWRIERYRCPIVFYNEGRNTKIAPSRSVWLYDDIFCKSENIFVVDFSTLYDNATSVVSPTAFGRYVQSNNYKGPVAGIFYDNNRKQQFTWKTNEILPSLVYKMQDGNITEAENTIFRVIRSLADVECAGNFCVTNAWDDSYLSIGICHWTVGSQGIGELAGLMAYFKAKYPDQFELYFAPFGLGVVPDWHKGQGYYNAGQHKYEGRLAFRTAQGVHQALIPESQRLNYLRSWHWNYRFSRAAAQCAEFRKAMYEMSLARLWDILSVKESNKTLGEYYRSETAAALLLRLHVNRPGAFNSLVRNLPPFDDHTAEPVRLRKLFCELIKNRKWKISVNWGGESPCSIPQDASGIPYDKLCENQKRIYKSDSTTNYTYFATYCWPCYRAYSKIHKYPCADEYCGNHQLGKNFMGRSCYDYLDELGPFKKPEKIVIKKIKKTLENLGFDTSGTLDAAIREFQIAASLPYVAKLNNGVLSCVANIDHRYRGSITGLQNNAQNLIRLTSSLIKEWETLNYHNPLQFVIETDQGAKPLTDMRVHALTDALRAHGGRFLIKVTDYGRSYADTSEATPVTVILGIMELRAELLGSVTMPPNDAFSSGVVSPAFASVLNDMVVDIPLGSKATPLDNPATRWAIKHGANEYIVRQDSDRLFVDIQRLTLTPCDSLEGTTPIVAATEFLPADLGLDPNSQENWQSTFRVLRAVSETTCQGWFDSLRFPEGAPPALGLASPEDPVGDLGLLMALAKHLCPTDWYQAFGRYGLATSRQWTESAGPNTYHGLSFFKEEARRFSGVSGFLADSLGALAPGADPGKYLTRWPWVYRLIMAVRSYPAIRRLLWDLGRLQLQALLQTPLPSGNSLGILSEKSMALLWLWHLRRPDEVVSSGRFQQRVADLLAEGTGTPAERLLDHLAKCGLEGAVKAVSGWPNARENGLPAYALKPKDLDASPTPPVLALLDEDFVLDSSHIVASNNMLHRVPRGIQLFPAQSNSAPFRYGITLVQEEVPGEKEGGSRFTITSLILTRPGTTSGMDRGVYIRLAKPLDSVLSPHTIVGQCEYLEDPRLSDFRKMDLYSLGVGSLGADQSLEFDIELPAWLATLSSSSLKCRLEIGDQNGQPKATATIIMRLDTGFLPEPLEWTFTRSGSLDPTCTIDDKGMLRQAFTQDWSRAFPGMPFTMSGSVEGEVALGFDPDADHQFNITADITGDMVLAVGSSLVLLHLPKATLGFDLQSERLDFTLPGPPSLALNLFAKEGGNGVAALAGGKTTLVDHLWANSSPGVATAASDSVADALSRVLCLKPPADFSLNRPIAMWRKNALCLSTKLFTCLEHAVVGALNRLQAFGGSILGGSDLFHVSFESAGADEYVDARTPGQLSIPLTVKVAAGNGTLFQGAGRVILVYRLQNEQENMAMVTMDSMACCGSFPITTVKEAPVTEAPDKDAYDFSSGLVSLHVPLGTVFNFSLDPSGPSLEWDTARSRANTDDGITVRIPEKDKGFTFDLQEFKVHTAGIDLRASVRSEQGNLGESKQTGIKSIFVLPPEPGRTSGKKEEPDIPRVGELIFKNSVLVYGCFKANVDLTYFDDAKGVLTLSLSQDLANRTLQVAGLLEITGPIIFHVDCLFASFQLTNLTLGISYSQDQAFLQGSWQGKGSMSGKILFLPAKGHSTSEMGEWANLFKGVSVEFEHLDPVQLGQTELKIHVPPKHFEFAKIFGISLQGVNIQGGGDTKPTALTLLGDITLKSLPGINSSLTLGDITLARNKTGPPELSISKIGVDFNVSGGFRVRGVVREFKNVEELKNTQEFGFAGEVTIKCEALPRELAGMVILNRFRPPGGEEVPTMAIYLGTDVDTPLLAGFYLRKLGLGLGINRVLRGFTVSDKPLEQQVQEIVLNPAGIPHPGKVESWDFDTKCAIGSTRWFLVGYGLISLGNSPQNVSHPICGDIVLAVNNDLDIIAGMNAWLYSSLEEVQTRDFRKHPVCRGALMVSPSRGALALQVRTLSNPRLGKDAPPLLQQVLTAVETYFSFTADPNGVVYKVGWPWDTRINFALGPFKGELCTGFLFAYYGGVIAFGQNFSIKLALEMGGGTSFGTSFGSARASLLVKGEASFRTTLKGAVAPNLDFWIVGDVRLDVSLDVRVRVDCEFSIGSGWFKISVSIRFDVTLFSFALNVTMVAALGRSEGSAQLGFKGNAYVSVSVCGFRIGGSVAVGSNEGAIDTANKFLASVLPPPLPKNVESAAAGDSSHGVAASPAITAMAMPGIAVAALDHERILASVGDSQSETAAASVSTPASTEHPPLASDASPAATKTTAQDWVYHYRVIQTAPGIHQVRVLLFPKPGGVYPRCPESKKSEQNGTGPRYRVTLVKGALFKGFLGFSFDGRKEEVPDTATDILEWSEDLDHVVIPKAQAKAFVTPTPGHSMEEFNPNMLLDVHLRDVLVRLNQDPGASSFAHCEEISDKRMENPVPEDFDDENAGVAPKGMHSPYLKQDSEYDRKLTKTVAKDTTRAGSEASSRKAPEKQSQPDKTTDAESPDQGIETGQLFLELITLLNDETADCGKPAQGYLLAPYMKCILVFELHDALAEDKDPVAGLIDTDKLAMLGGQADIGLQAAEDRDINIDIRPGITGQTNQNIALSWTLVAKRGDNDFNDDFEHFKQIRAMVVTRRNLTQQDQEVLRMELLPAWHETIDEVVENKKKDDPAYKTKPLKPKQLLKPQMQLWDTKLEGIADGDLLQYRIAAVSVSGRELASTLVNVRYVRVVPLLPPTQALALQVVENVGGNFKEKVFVRVQVPTESLDAGSGNPEARMRQHCTLHYRYRPASRIGSYGFVSDHAPPEGRQGPTGEAGGYSVTAQLDQVHERASGEEMVYWEDTTPVPDGSLAWKLVSQPENVQDAKRMLFQVKLKAMPPTPPGLAVEFFVGLDQARDNFKLYKRSRLAGCRHAVVAKPGWKPLESLKDQNDLTLFFGQGNSVSALEPLQLLLKSYAAGAGQFLDEQRVAARVVYAEGTDWPHLDVQIRHDASQRGEGHQQFNPVVGYRLFRQDEYARQDLGIPDSAKPGVEQKEAQVLTLADQELEIQAVPRRWYQAFPSSIVPTAMGGKTTNLRLSNWQPEVRTKENNKTVACAGELSTLAFGDPSWVSCTDPFWLCKDLSDTLERICTDKYHAVFVPVQPLLYTSETAAKAISAEQRLDRLAETWTAGTDPHGWYTLESLGLSCQFRLEDKSGDPVDVGDIEKAVTPALCGRPVTLVRFRAEDGQTLLHILRLVHTGTLLSGNEPSRLTSLALGKLLQGANADGGAWTSDAVVLAKATVWLRDIDECRLGQTEQSLCGEHFNGKCVTFRQVFSLSAPGQTLDPHEDRPTSSSLRALPVGGDGCLQIRLEVPNQLAHVYRLGGEVVRRYDKLFEQLDMGRGDAGRKIPCAAKVHVQRTASLPAAPLVQATPLASGFQALFYKHPAAYAAEASLRNALCGEYSGSSLCLEMRIATTLADKSKDFCEAHADIAWAKYNERLNNHVEFASERPSPDKSPCLQASGEENQPLALQYIPGSDTGVFGVDRYVYPDLPAYYEYRVHAHVTAGRACSERVATPWQTPMLDRPGPQARQTPNVDALWMRAEWNEKKGLELAIRTLHPRAHLHEGVRHLWRNADLGYPVSPEQDVEYGAMPDLDLAYQIYLVADAEEKNGNRTEVLRPLAAILPVPDKEGRFVLEVKPERLTANQDGDTEIIDHTDPKRFYLKVRWDEELGLHFRFVISQSGDEPSQLLEWLRGQAVSGTPENGGGLDLSGKFRVALAKWGVSSGIATVKSQPDQGERS